jgi:hypothetical protein
MPAVSLHFLRRVLLLSMLRRSSGGGSGPGTYARVSRRLPLRHLRLLVLQPALAPPPLLHLGLCSQGGR